MQFKNVEIEGLVLIKPSIYTDERGLFFESYKMSEFQKHGIPSVFVQDNYSKSFKGVLRGLHYQSGVHSQSKLIRCVKGAIYDVAVDIRRGSATFGKWFGVELSEENKLQLYIPNGFAHGFYTLSDEAVLVYKTSHEYVPQADKGIIWNDQDIAIAWQTTDPILSERDKRHPRLSEIGEDL
jgi:dTDP-4-dehydrorhamnose 3,5-epimerase